MAEISLTITAVLAIIMGIIVLIFPGLLRWAIGLFLLAFGALQLVNQYF
ncbi:MAG: DUF3096 domain-containing protein [Nanoarchaeota archaeon]